MVTDRPATICVASFIKLTGEVCISFTQKRVTPFLELKTRPGNAKPLCLDVCWEARSPLGVEASPEHVQVLLLQGPCRLYSMSVSCILLRLATNRLSLGRRTPIVQPECVLKTDGGVLQLSDSFNVLPQDTFSVCRIAALKNLKDKCLHKIECVGLRQQTFEMMKASEST